MKMMRRMKTTEATPTLMAMTLTGRKTGM